MTWYRPWSSFRANPSSLKSATLASICVTLVLVSAGAVVIRVFDSAEYPTFGDALWFTLQTITTVGYGDNTPVTAVGQIVTSVVMLVSIGLITVITAGITSIFIESARSQRIRSDDDGPAASLARIEAALADTSARLDQIETQSSSLSPEPDDAS